MQSLWETQIRCRRHKHWARGRFHQSILATIDQCLELQETERVQGCKELLQRLRETEKPAPGIAEATAKERQTTERQPVPHRIPNGKNQRTKASPVRRKSSGKGIENRDLFLFAVICGLALLAIIVIDVVKRQDAQDFPLGSPASNFEVTLPQEGPNGADRVEELSTTQSANPSVASNASPDVGGNASGNSPELRSVPSYAESNTNPGTTSRDLQRRIAPRGAESGLADNTSPSLTGREKSSAPSNAFFTHGSHADDVLRIQGTPEAVNTYESLGKEAWFYGYSSVEISLTDRRVIGWYNTGNNLKVTEIRGEKSGLADNTSSIVTSSGRSSVPGSGFFTRGSHADDVLRIQGTPTEISTYEALGKETWRYGYSTVEISLPDRRVTDWSNNSNNLKVQMQPGRNVTSARFFTRGSHADDVLRIQGTPTEINTYEALGKETWRYGYSTVEISLSDRRVTDWSNNSNNLKVQMPPGRNVTSARFFTRGSHADDVLRIQGTPTEISTYEALGKETWRYGYSTVEISLPDRRVTDWSNNSNNLKVQMQPGATR